MLLTSSKEPLTSQLETHTEVREYTQVQQLAVYSSAKHYQVIEIST